METFIVTGIQMRNKGSQAMFLSLRHSLRAIYPGCDVVGFANKYDNPDQYTFRLLPYDDYTRSILRLRLHRVPFLEKFMTFMVGRLKGNRKWHNAVPQMVHALRSADAIFDASGYTLGSGWPKQSGEVLLNTVRLARRFRKPIILMPQSFGPFDWGKKDDARFIAKVARELRYPVRIYAREHEGYESLVALGLDNVELSADMVIREAAFPRGCDIIKGYMRDKRHGETKDSVGFIVNSNLSRFSKASSVIDLYVSMIKKALSLGEKVCLVSTSTADATLVDGVVRALDDPSAVQIIKGEYASPELIELIASFKFIVASRYHSIVFAYRSGVPAVILGWSTKYSDLAALFGQSQYVFDVRGSRSHGILAGIAAMSVNWQDEARTISDSLQDVQESSVVLHAAHLLEPRPSLAALAQQPAAATPNQTVNYVCTQV